ncbi:MAG: hypothetical protein IPK04_07565 [Bdellovibrionales bacterium]|nr:hypothetical protein [Bdellovibrionales bacterium]
MNSTAAQLLRNSFERKKASQGTFSIRSFAKTMKLSPSFLSAILQGKKSIPLARIDQIAKILDLDLLALTELKRAIAQQVLNEHNFSISSQGSVTHGAHNYSASDYSASDYSAANQSASKKYRSAPKYQF